MPPHIRSWLKRFAPLGIAAGAATWLVVMLWPSKSASAAAVPPRPAPTPLPVAATPPPRTAPAPAPHPPPAPVTGGTPSPPAGSLAAATEPQYARFVLDAALAGRWPSWFAQLVPVQVASGGHAGVFYATPTHLVVLDPNGAPFYAALSAPAAQQVADRHGWSLPTRKMSDDIHVQATVRVPFHAYSADRALPRTFAAASSNAAARLVAGLASGYSKDYVLTKLRRSTPGKIAIYGAWDSQGTLVQPLAVPHALTYYDYSQHPRFVGNQVLVDGRPMSLAAALADPIYAPLFSSEGTITGTMLRY